MFYTLDDPTYQEKPDIIEKGSNNYDKIDHFAEIDRFSETHF